MEEPIPSILKFVETIIVSPTTSMFVAKEKFVVSTEPNEQVRIKYLNNSFKEWFLSGSDKTDDLSVVQTLRCHELCKSTAYAPIIIELGGEVRAEISLSETFSLMEIQKHGEDGVLLNNGMTNLFFIKDNNGVLRGVGMYWYKDGWFIFAHPAEISFEWNVGYRVFSRNVVLESLEPQAKAHV